MMTYLIELILIFLAFFLSYIINMKIKNFDYPGKNKVQKIKVITSGGLVPFLFFIFILFYIIYFDNFDYSEYFLNIPQIWMVPLITLIFLFISFIDDFNYIPFQVRLFLQIILVYLSLSLFPVNPDYNFQTPIFDGLIPLKIDIVLTIIFWIFIINSTNFIDGYDGMFSFQIITNFFGLSVIFFMIDEIFHFKVAILMFFIGVLFLPFNLGKKFKMYIGDTGSIPGGFILGWMIISLINMGYFFCAILLNILFLIDILFTLLKRVFQKKSIFIRHNDFFFKKVIKKYGVKRYYLYAIPIQLIIILISIYPFL